MTKVFGLGSATFTPAKIRIRRWVVGPAGIQAICPTRSGEELPILKAYMAITMGP
jgi:hypothetical protein